MKLKPFLEFLEKHQVTKVLHKDASRSGTIIDVDYDDKRVTIKKQNGDISHIKHIKIMTLLSQYQLVSKLLGGNYVRLGDTHSYKVGQEVIYFAESKSYHLAKGRIIHIDAVGVSVKWEHGEQYTFRNDHTLNEILFVRFNTYYVLIPTPCKQGLIVAATIRAATAVEAEAAIPSIFKLMPEGYYSLVLKIGK